MRAWRAQAGLVRQARVLYMSAAREAQRLERRSAVSASSEEERAGGSRAFNAQNVHMRASLKRLCISVSTRLQ